MANKKNINANDKELTEKSETFVQKVNSDMYFQSELTSDSMSFEWVDVIERICPYIDNIIRNPKLALINEEDIVKIEKAKRISVASVKDLAKHTHFIEKIDPITNEVKPSKILIERREETFNTYENRFIYTLVTNLYRFLVNKESLLEALESKKNKILEYAASSNTGIEKVNIELKISSFEIPKGKSSDEFQKEIESIKARIKKINDYIISWRRSEFIESLEKAHVPFVFPPIRKTNMILKNPNFQMAMQLWEFLQAYDLNENQTSKDSLETTGDDNIKGILDNTFFINYLVLDSLSGTKKEQKDKLSKYAILMLKQQVQRTVSLLFNMGIDISEKELLDMISIDIQNEKNKRLVGTNDVKKKFKNAMDEYLEKIKEYM